VGEVNEPQVLEMTEHRVLIGQMVPSADGKGERWLQLTALKLKEEPAVKVIRISPDGQEKLWKLLNGPVCP
jgi:hypothetical protein